MIDPRVVIQVLLGSKCFLTNVTFKIFLGFRIMIIFQVNIQMLHIHETLITLIAFWQIHRSVSMFGLQMLFQVSRTRVSFVTKVTFDS